MSQKASTQGRFTFTTHTAGDHELCFQTAAGGGWFSSTNAKLSLDLAIGETSDLGSGNSEKIMSLAERVRELNGRLMDIKREQAYQREREMEFRDQSESTNARIVRWTILQLVILGVTCAWQLTHLKSNTTFYIYISILSFYYIIKRLFAFVVWFGFF